MNSLNSMILRLCVLLLLGVASIRPLSAQDRDVRGERLIIDDNANDSTWNTMTIRTPGSLDRNVVLTVPDMGTDSAQFMLLPMRTAGAWLLGGNTGIATGVDYLGTSDGTPLHLYVNGGEQSLILNTNGSMQRDTAGGVRGTGTVDLQNSRSAEDRVASGNYAFIGGGTSNRADENWTVIGGGASNSNSSRFGTIGGGRQNTLKDSGLWAVIGGGSQNTVAGQTSTIAGGDGNDISAHWATIGGGHGNTVEADNGTVAGGDRNMVGGPYSVVGGGFRNTVSARESAIPGGKGLTLSGHASFGFHASDTGLGLPDRPMTVAEASTTVFGNTDVWLANNDSAASRLRFYEANSDTGAFPMATTYYTSFEAGDQSQDINYVLPTTPPIAAGQVLASTTGGVMSWVDPASSVDAWNLTGNIGTTAGTDYVGTADTNALHLYVNAGTDNALILNANGSIQHGTTGNTRGDGAVDLQVNTVAGAVASGTRAFVGAGEENRATATNAFVGGGSKNTASANNAFVGGGRGNSGSGTYSSVAGGLSNRASGNSGFIGGGYNNVINGSAYTVIGGGRSNNMTGTYSGILGGQSNSVTGDFSSLLGGYTNVASAHYSAVLGGYGNVAGGTYGVVLGGRGLELTGNGSLGYLGNNDGGTSPMQISEANTAVFGNTDLWLANNDGSASRLRFYEANNDTGAFPTATTYYTSFEAGDQNRDINYILPTDAPTTNGQVLSGDTNGVLHWAEADSEGWSLTGNAGTAPGSNYLGTSDSTALYLYVNGGSNNGLILNTNGSIQRDSAGNARGVGAVDMQYERDGNTSNVASGAYSTLSGGFANRSVAEGTSVSGGKNNAATKQGGTVGGGWDHTASGNFSTVSGGRGNTAGEKFATVSGGNNNTASIDYATVGGGKNNAASHEYTSVGGGLENTASSYYATVGGGTENQSTGTYGTIGGGIRNKASGTSSNVGGGSSNTASGTGSMVGGGSANVAKSFAATVAGGNYNEAKGAFTAIPGGRGMTLTGSGSFGFLGGNSSFGLVQNGNKMTVGEKDIAVFGNVDLMLANNNGAASRLRFYEANNDAEDFPATPSGTVFYTSFEAGDLDTNLIYILPTAMPTSNNQFLYSDTNGVMSWSDGPTGAQSFGNEDNTTPTLALENNVGTDDGVALEITEGSIILSNAQGAPTTIPDDVAIYDVNDATGSSAPSVGLPAAGTNGRILYVFVSDPDGATVGGAPRGTSDKLTYIYIGGGWQLFHVN